MAGLQQTRFVDWAAEPDHKELTVASQLLTGDPIAALPRLMVLAERGSATSMICIGDAYRFGLGTNVDSQKAEDWYRRAVLKGAVLGYYDLASLYLATHRVGEARRLLEFSAARGYPPALNLLGRMYLSGNGAEKDLQRARLYLERASAAGHIPGKAALARLLMKHQRGFLMRARGALLMITAQISLWIILFWEGFSSERLR